MASQSDPQKRAESYQRRYMLQAAAARLLPREKVCTCQRRPIPAPGVGGSVSVLHHPGGGGSFAGLMQCGSVWLCPVCSAKISERRRLELASAIERWRKVAPEGRILLVTFTLSHHRGESLSGVLAALTHARKQIVSGRWAKAFRERYQIAGMIRALEITYGDNGWHPHLHVLYLLRSEPAILAFEEELKTRWGEALASAGAYASYQHGVHVAMGNGPIAEYIAKYGKEPQQGWSYSHEMVKGGSKSSRGGMTPWAVLEGYATLPDGPERERLANLWLQYAAAMKGQRQLHWSHGLRELLGLAEEQSDQELAEEQEHGSIVLAVLSDLAWRAVLANDARADLLTAAASGERTLLADVLESLAIDPNWYRFP